MTTSTGSDTDLQGPELWRRQCARNLMDCYALGMEAAGTGQGAGRKAADALARLMVEGMTAVRSPEDERGFYRLAARLCEECAAACKKRAALFRVYGAIFGELAGQGDVT